jgi:limonene-1,2-epoxide hydrolase
MPTPSDIVREFCAAFARLDVDELLGYFAPDATYHNIPIDPAVGHEAIRGLLTMFTGMATSIDFQIRHLAADGDVVLTERVDVFEMADKTVSLPVMGTFEVRDGKIAAWRDYFDLQQFMSQSGA